MVNELVIWAHSECRSNAALYAEVKRLAEARGLLVTMCLWDVRPIDESRKAHGIEYARIGNDIEKGRAILAAHCGVETVHVFCVYQNSTVWRRLIAEAKRGGARVVVSAEAPCEMCTGVKALAKRFYYRFVLPWRVCAAVRSADMFLNASGRSGVGRLLRIGWAKEKIVPFGYASDVNVLSNRGTRGKRGKILKILHTGVEKRYRGFETLQGALGILRDKGVQFELKHTKGDAPQEELARLYDWADVFVGCGLCEPWGMRVNDAIHAGLPVVVSSGMGAKWLVEQYGCGAVFKKGDAKELSDILERTANDDNYFKRLQSGVSAAHIAWTPAARAHEWLRAVLGE